MTTPDSTEDEPQPGPPPNVKLSILIPVYNEEETLEEIIEHVQKTPFNKELILVDDQSQDRSPAILEELAERYGNMKVIRHEKNQGKGAAIATAMQHFTGDIVLIQDADLEYDPSDYGALLQPILDGHADVVYGSRFLGGSYSRAHLYHHYLGNKALTVLSNLVTNLNLTDMETCYKVFRADVARKLNLKSKTFAVEPEITCKVAKLKARIYEVPIRYAGRDYAAGKKIRPRDGFLAIGALIRYGIFGRRPE